MELLELHPTTSFECQPAGSSSVGKTLANLPEVCKFTFCECCNEVMPPRSEHCDSCNKCILRADQHCTWVGSTCIGMLNHKFFILYLFYGAYFSLQILGPFIKLLFIGSDDPEEELGNRSFTELLETYPNEFIAFSLAISLIITLGLIFVYQFTILLMNKTTMEVTIDPSRSPFRHANVIRNIEMVFGSRKCVWLSPFHAPFPNMKLHTFTPDELQLMSYGVPIKSANQT